MDESRPLCVWLGKGGCRIVQEVLQILFPPRCAVCDEILEAECICAGKMIHPACEAKLYPVGANVCFCCGRPLASEEREYCYNCIKRFRGTKPVYCRQGKAVYIYRGEIRKSVYRFKYSNRREYAGFYAQQAAETYADWIHRIGVDAIVPVPMYKPKMRRRGYNQAEIFGAGLAEICGLPLVKNGVRRIKNTRPQKYLSDEERKNNLKKAFQAADFIVKYKKILIVDDIYTTGSTVEAVAGELRRCGVEEVFFLALCTGEGISI